MNQEEKKKHLESLLSNDAFKAAVSSATDASEKEKISAFAQDVFLSIIEGLTAVEKVVRENPEKVAEVLAKHIPKE